MNRAAHSLRSVIAMTSSRLVSPARRIAQGLLALSAAGTCVLAGCGTSLTVRHLDPENERAQVWLNGQVVGEVRYGDSLELAIGHGQHRLKATRPGEVDNAWNEGGGYWRIVVLDDVVLSLLPKPDKAVGPSEP